LTLAGEAGASPGESALERSPWRAKALLGLGSLLVDRREQFVTAGILLEEAVSIFREIEEPSGLASGLYWLADKAWTESNVASAQSLYEESLAYAQAAGVRWVVGKCLDSLAGFADIEGDHLKARKLKEEAVVVMREVGDQKELAAPVMWLAYRIWGEGDTDKARGLIEEILPELRGTGARKEIVYLQNMLTIWTAVQGDFEKGRTYLEETLTISQELKSKYLLAWTLFISGIVDYLEGALEPARAHIEQSNQLFRELDYSYDISWNLEYLGQVYARLGDHTKAIALLEESLAFEFGGTESKANKLLPLGDALRAQGDIERAADCYRQSMMLQAEIKAVVNIPPRLEALAKLAAIQGQPERSARLFGAAQAGRERFGTPLPPVERPEYESSLAVVRSGLGEECFAAAWLAGRAMTLEGATAYALEAGGGQNHEEGTGA
jgi:tetratricopeptide (TPR) repeat protein